MPLLGVAAGAAILSLLVGQGGRRSPISRGGPRRFKQQEKSRTGGQAAPPQQTSTEGETRVSSFMAQTRVTISDDGLTGNIGKDWWKTRGRHICMSARARDPDGDVAMETCKMAAASFDWEQRPLPHAAKEIYAAVQQFILESTPAEQPEQSPDVAAPAETAVTTTPDREVEDPVLLSSDPPDGCASASEDAKAEAEAPSPTAPAKVETGKAKTRRGGRGKNRATAEEKAKESAREKAKAKRRAKAEKKAKAKAEEAAKATSDANPAPEISDGSGNTPEAGN